MYNIGDKVLYPMHGAGVIEDIEERDILGEKKKYYVMRMPLGDMKVMIPMDSVDVIGIRDIISEDAANQVIRDFADIENVENSNWNKRFRENMVHIKSGDIREVSSVVKSLMCRDFLRGLSTGERKMLQSAKQILISEIVLATGRTFADVESELKGIAKEQTEKG